MASLLEIKVEQIGGFLYVKHIVSDAGSLSEVFGDGSAVANQAFSGEQGDLYSGVIVVVLHNWLVIKRLFEAKI